MTKENEHNCINEDDLLNNTKLNIDKFGLQVIMVGSTSYSSSFSYSVGLWETYNHPEIICFGLSNDLGHAIINDVAEIIKQGEFISVGKEYTEIFDKSNAFIFVEIGSCFFRCNKNTKTFYLLKTYLLPTSNFRLPSNFYPLSYN